MSKVAVVFWSGSGNTEAMANLIVDSAKDNGAEVDLFPVDEFSADKMADYSAIAFGCPASGDNELEDSEFLPVYEECRANLKDKKISLFGSYNWAEGEWLEDWSKQAKDEDGAIFVCDPVKCYDDPEEDEEIDACKNIGKALATA